MKVAKRLIIFICLSAFFSCKEPGTKVDTPAFAPELNTTSKHKIIGDSIEIAKKVTVNEKKLKRVRAGKPMMVPVNEHIRSAGIPQRFSAAFPVISTPGKDSFHLPRITAISEKAVPALMPEIYPVKDMSFKLPNPYSFGTFGKMHGLKHSIVSCLLQDRSGNIWICTKGGVSRFDGRSFTHFTEKEGLVFNDVRSIIQDKSGNIWFGTLGGGVSKYDGYSFVSFTKKDGLSDNYVVGLKEDRLGNIWMATWNGVTRYDGKSFTNYTRQQGLVNNFVYTVIEDQAGNIWFGTGDGVSKFDGKSFLNFGHRELGGKREICTILEDKTGGIWLGTNGNGVLLFKDALFTNYTEIEGLVNNEVFSLLQDREGNVWMGTHFGLSKFNGSSFTNFTQSQGLSNDNIYCLLEDKTGNLWIGTGGGGVSKHDPHSFVHITETEGLLKNYMFSVMQDLAGNLWFGSWRGGVAKYDGRSIKTYTSQQGLTNDDVRGICQDRSGNIWFATYKGVSKYDGRSFVHFTEKDGLVNNDVLAIMADSAGNIWAGTVAGASKYDGRSFTNFTRRQGLTNNSVYCMKQDRQGAIWFGVTEGLYQYQGEHFEQVTDRQGILQWGVICIAEDVYHNLWLGTSGYGVLQYNGTSIRQLTQKDGLIHNDVASILADRSGDLWFGTRYGLSTLSAERLAQFSERGTNIVPGTNDVLFKNYGYTDGFLGVGCNTNAILQSNDGKIWIGTNGGMTSVTASGNTRDSVPSPVQLTAVKLANEPIDWVKLLNRKDTSFRLGNGIQVKDFHFNQLTRWYPLPEKLSLAHNNNYIGFDFTCIDIGRSQHTKFQYQLEGTEKGRWVLTELGSVSYHGLAPGKYTFKVKAQDSRGHWSEELKYMFTIRPPWWKTWWFTSTLIIVVLVFLFMAGRFIYLYQLRKQKIILEKQLAVQIERQRISSDLHDEIGSTLSSINIYAGLARKEPDNSSLLDSITQNVNEVVNKLDDLVWSIHPNDDTLSSIGDRLYAYAFPAAKAKDISFILENHSQQADILLSAPVKHNVYLVAKELINNALKHAGCQEIRVVLTLQENTFFFSVIDNGSGFDESSAQSDRNGLKNIRQRVLAMKGTIHTISARDTGTKTMVRIPVS